MQPHIERIKNLAFSATAKDTLVLFVGNIFSAFWGFLFTLIIARSFSIADFGVFSAALNLINILASLADVGISTGSVNFIVEHLAKGNIEKANEYLKASLILRVFFAFVISVPVVIFAPVIASRLLATHNSMIAIWVAVIPFFWLPDSFFTYILQARKKFFQSVVYDNSFYLARLIFTFTFYMIGMLTMPFAFWAFGAGFLMNVILTLVFVRLDFLSARPTRKEYRSLLGFSGWIGVNRIISSVSGKLDIQMLAALSGAVATGLYSIPSRLASFIIVLSGSFSSVLATRMAGFGDKSKEKSYLIKSTLALLPMAGAVIAWIIFAKPFIVLLFGVKYLPSVPVFQALAASQIPFLFTVPPVTAIIYSIKKTFFIGSFSFFQITAIFILNFFLIPKYGPFGPTITFAVTNTILAIYVWVIVIKHYWNNK